MADYYEVIPDDPTRDYFAEAADLLRVKAAVLQVERDLLKGMVEEHEEQGRKLAEHERANLRRSGWPMGKDAA